MTKKRLAQKDEWLRKAGNSSLVELLGDKVAELNKEGKEMDILQKDDNVTEVTEITETPSDQSVINPELVSNEVVKEEKVVVTTVLTKEEVASTFAELLAPILDEQKLLKEANEALVAKIEKLEREISEKNAVLTETVASETPVASLTSLVKERLFAQLNSKVNGFGQTAVVKENDPLLTSKPAVKVEKEEQPKHTLQGLLEGF